MRRTICAAASRNSERLSNFRCCSTLKYARWQMNVNGTVELRRNDTQYAVKSELVRESLELHFFELWTKIILRNPWDVVKQPENKGKYFDRFLEINWWLSFDGGCEFFRLLSTLVGAKNSEHNMPFMLRKYPYRWVKIFFYVNGTTKERKQKQKNSRVDNLWYLFVFIFAMAQKSHTGCSLLVFHSIWREWMYCDLGSDVC